MLEGNRFSMEGGGVGASREEVLAEEAGATEEEGSTARAALRRVDRAVEPQLVGSGRERTERAEGGLPAGRGREGGRAASNERVNVDTVHKGGEGERNGREGEGLAGCGEREGASGTTLCAEGCEKVRVVKAAAKMGRGKASSFLKVSYGSSTGHHVQGFEVGLEEDGGVVRSQSAARDEAGGSAVEALQTLELGGAEEDPPCGTSVQEHRADVSEVEGAEILQLRAKGSTGQAAQLGKAGEAFGEYVVDMRGHGESIVDVDTKDTGGRNTPDGVGPSVEGPQSSANLGGADDKQLGLTGVDKHEVVGAPAHNNVSGRLETLSKEGWGVTEAGDREVIRVLPVANANGT